MTNGKARVGLFVTCIVDLMRPRVGFAAAKLIEDAGFRVSVPAQTCCGQPNYNAGAREQARSVARSVIETFAEYDYVVTPSGSCAGMVRRHYPALFSADEPERDKAALLAARTYELTRFLSDVAHVKALDTRHDGALAYHDCCAGLRELGVKREPRDLLALVAGAAVKPLQEPETCCGFGGAFCVKYPDISNRMVEEKIDDIASSGAGAVVMGDTGCLLHIEGAIHRKGLPIRTYHIAEVLAGMTESESP